MSKSTVKPALPSNNRYAWQAFRNLAQVYNINFEFNDKNEIGFEREQFMRLMDLYALLFNSVQIYSDRFVVGFRTDYLRPGTHLLGAFMLFEDRYRIQSRFDDNGKKAWFDNDGFTKLVQDIISWSSSGGPMQIC